MYEITDTGRIEELIKENYIGIPWNHYRLKARARQFKAEHCADFIRIYGEVIEEVVRGAENLKRTSYQTGDPYHWAKYAKKSQPGYGQPLLDKGRRRYERTDTNFQLSNPQFEGPQTPAHEVLTSSPIGGIRKWRVMERDTVGKMDQVGWTS